MIRICGGTVCGTRTAYLRAGAANRSTTTYDLVSPLQRGADARAAQSARGRGCYARPAKGKPGSPGQEL